MSSTPSSGAGNTARILESSWRETRFVAALWLVACAWTVGYASLFAYRTEAPPRLILGMPDWVLWGIVAPWMVCLALSIWFALRGMRDEELGEAEDVPTEAGLG